MDSELTKILSDKKNLQDRKFQVMEIQLINDIVDYIVSETTTSFYIDSTKHHWYIEFQESHYAKIWFSTNTVEINEWLQLLSTKKLSMNISKRIDAVCNIRIANNKFIMTIE